ncbi:MAG: hypothetical protein PHX43_08680 [Alphaproteobacteria bacterium]|nr:hypothetical protein [Alphaproteobacteria bacterium]
MKRAQDRLSLEKAEVVSLHPLEAISDKEEYASIYVRAEQLGLKIIKKSLNEVNWLPLRLDPDSEMMTSNRESMKQWVARDDLTAAPSAEIFGNDFMHVLTRASIHFGWDDIRIAQLAHRIALLFRDLSCLVGIVYYSAWLAEQRVDHVLLTDPTNLFETAKEFAEITAPKKEKKTTPTIEQDKSGMPKEKGGAKRPTLRVIKDDDME